MEVAVSRCFTVAGLVVGATVYALENLTVTVMHFGVGLLYDIAGRLVGV